LNDGKTIPDDLFELGQWIAKYYAAPLGRVLSSMLPGGVRRDVKAKRQHWVMRAKTREELIAACIEVRAKAPLQARVLEEILPVTGGILLTALLEKSEASRQSVAALVKKGFLSLSTVATDHSPLATQEYFQSPPKTLNAEQSAALQSISAALDSASFAPFLLYGITGSGKTEIYLQAIANALNQGKGTIVLVPEIALTQQTIERFRSRFTEKIALLHHRLSDGERAADWQGIYSGEIKIVIGARSAIFSPVQNLGLIIVDEEHEQSYKQTDATPCYHARDIAMMRANLTKSVIILGSATPSLESYYNVQKGKYSLRELRQRADVALLPSVSVVDMNAEYAKAKGPTLFSDLLLTEVKKRYEVGEQSLLFLNRRGYHTTQLCQQCQKTTDCPQCELALTFHRGDNILSCHLCGYALKPPPSRCTKCGTDMPLKFRGAGTEQLERALHAIFPDIRTLRLDADTTRHKGSHEKLLRQFRSGKADVLIGTQMIAKGLHLPQVTLVGVINCDGSLNIPDFRSSEKIFQLLTQVAGRAGRGALPGAVIIQTLMPDNEIIHLASQQDFKQYYEKEIEARKLFAFPPFTHLIKLVFSGIDAALVEQCALQLHARLTHRLTNPSTQILPVVPCGYAKIKNKYRFQCLLRGPSVYFLNDQIQAVLHTLKWPKAVHLSIDVDPLSTYF
jgi:primosomal protein N' (replication factor Y) (superfamily II helicase)